MTLYVLVGCFIHRVCLIISANSYGLQLTCRHMTEYNHCQLQLRISHQWFIMNTLLNTHLNFMGRAVLLDNPTSRVSYLGNIPRDNIFVYTYSYSCQYVYTDITEYVTRGLGYPIS